MSDEIMEIEESFADLLEKSIKTLNTGEKVTGVVTEITPTEIYVDLGTKHAGYIPVSELSDDPTVKVEDIVKIGDEIETYVMRVNDAEGVVTLSKKRLDTVKSWDDVEQAREEGTIVEGVVTEENKGGVVASVKGVRVFIPASQTGLPRDAAMSDLLKKKVRMKITEVNRARRRVVGSIRAVEQAERAEKSAKVWAEIENGKRYSGVVKSLTSYGAFVDIGGVDGILVCIIALQARQKALPDAALQFFQRGGMFVPTVKITKDTDLYGIGRPDAEEVALLSVLLAGVRAEAAPGVTASALRKGLQLQKQVIFRQFSIIFDQ